MVLTRLSLQNFRSYKKNKFEFYTEMTLIVGPNTSGKSNLIESIFLLSTGKSFRADKDEQLITFSEEVARAKGEVLNSKGEETDLEVVLTKGEVGGQKTQSKKYLVNGVPRRRSDFAGNLPAVLFSPQDLDIIIESPSLRRRFLDNVLYQIDREYASASTAYSKALRQRNALLESIRESGVRNEKQLEYWDHLVIENGEKITKKRQDFLDYVNNAPKDIFDFVINYDKSVISKARLEQYKDAEVASGVTLVGPHRDDFNISMFDDVNHTTHDVKLFGSRGQQRLAILQLKMLELSFFEKILGKKPILLLDDIFSELDEEHIALILEMSLFERQEQKSQQQIIITTAHRELVPERFLKEMKVIEFDVK